MAAEESSNFMAIAADGHGTPTAAARAGIVVEEETAGGIGTPTDGSARAFHKKLRGGTRDGREEPFQATFAGDIVQGPGAVVRDELVMAFCDAQDFVDRFDPGSRKRFLLYAGSEDGAEAFSQAEYAEQDSIDRVRLGGEKRA